MLKDDWALFPTTRKSESSAAANSAVAAAATNAAAATAAPAAASHNAAAAAASAVAASPTVTATDALPPIVPEGRFAGYMSSRYVGKLASFYQRSAQEDFDHWQDEVTDGLPVQFMRRHMMLTAIRSKRTDAPT